MFYIIELKTIRKYVTKQVPIFYSEYHDLTLLTSKWFFFKWFIFHARVSKYYVSESIVLIVSTFAEIMTCKCWFKRIIG